MTNDELAARTTGQTVATRFLDTVRRRGGAAALRWRDGEGFGSWTWNDYAAGATRVAAALGDLGVGRGDRVALLMRNRPEFHVADVGTLLVGATPISIYNSSAPDQIEYLMGHSGVKVAIVEDADYLGRCLEVRDALPELRQLVVIDDPDHRAPADVLAWSALARHADPVDLEAAARVARPDDLATVIYTSGTTGPPKGVMLDHANVCWTVESLRLALGDYETEGRRVVSYLPMAHVAERMVTHYQGVALGYEVTTCPDPSLIASYLGEVHPEIFFAVPRVLEKMHSAVMALLGGDPERQTEFEHALALGGRAAAHRAGGTELPADLATAYEKVESELLGPARELLGLDEVIAAVSGAAPLPRGILDFFRGLGVPLSEIYGLSETSGPMTWTPFRVRPGAVGPPIPGEEVRLADDGEVLCRGGNVFRGYLDDPEKTSAALTADGWFHTGDIGQFDEAGYLEIVDRKKELIITAGGKNISPANLEAALKAIPLVGQACVIGDGRPFLSALLVLDEDVAPAWAARQGLADASLAELAVEPELLAEVQQGVDRVNDQFSRVEGIKRFLVLPHEWLPDSEELTPTMKLKRRGIHTRYAEQIEAIYSR